MEKPYLIGVCGGSASGKTKIIEALQLEFSADALAIVNLDNYYRGKHEQLKDENGKVNYDLPQAIDFDLLNAHLTELTNGNPIVHQEYQFQLENSTPKIFTIKPAPIIIVEGLFVFHNPTLNSLLHLKVMVQATTDVMYKRRMERDIKERGVPKDYALYQWERHVLPAFEKFVKPFFQSADIVLVNNHNYYKGLQLLTDHLKTRLRY